MKRNTIMQLLWGSLLLQLLLFILLLVLMPVQTLKPAIGILLVICLLNAGILLAGFARLSKWMRFLIADHKKGHAQASVWDADETEQLRLIRKRVEVLALQSQINPHFLYNTLDSIRSRALLDGHREIASMTEILSKFFRYCISHDEGLVKIQEELNHIQSYYFIQKYRFEERLEMKIEIEDEEISQCYIPKMTLQPLVENAMIHGLERVNRKGIVTIRIYRTEKRIIIVISDNGAGMSPEQLIKLNQRMDHQLYDAGKKRGNHNGIALTNVNSRIRITFGESFGIHYRSIVDGGTDAQIVIPVIDEFKRIKYENTLQMEGSNSDEGAS